MMNAVSETNRRRSIQEAFNKEHGIVPKTIRKDIRNVFEILDSSAKEGGIKSKGKTVDIKDVMKADAKEKDKVIATNEMKKAAKELDFEKAAEVRDMIIEIKGE